MTIYRCYSCGKEVLPEELRYECMCNHRKGICKECINIPLKDYKEMPNPNSNFKRLHELTSEYKRWCEMLKEECGHNWVGLNKNNNNTINVTYYEGPKGEKDETLTEKYPYYIYNEQLRKSFLKNKILPGPPEKICTCC